MDVNAVNNGTTAVNNYPATTTASTNETAAAGNEKETTSVGDAAVYEASDKANKTYKPDASKIKQLLEESERQTSAFQKLVEGLFNKQASKAGQAAGNLDGFKNLKDVISSLEVDEATRAQAQKDVEEGGYYSVEETAKRILDFAVAVSGGDPDKIEKLQKAVEQGFGEAAKVWGDKLPDISQKTYDAVMQGFDEWKKAGSADAITLLNKK